MSRQRVAKRGKSTSTEVTLTDLFCGAGGSSQGAHAAGITVRIAANHWRLAVETHNTNFPETDHDCADISQADPRRYPTTTILWASPECTNHSLAKGKARPTLQGSLFDQPLPDEAAQRSRATMWDVVRFAEVHAYEYIVVENVVDVRDWLLWDGWWASMRALGYDGKLVCLNSMHAASETMKPAPQSRDRAYVVFWRKGAVVPDLEMSPKGWCGRCSAETELRQNWKNPLRPWGRYKDQYNYRCRSCHEEVVPYTLPAAVAIDWTNVGQRIGDRDRALADKTRMRIAAGLKKYARPMQVEVGGHQYDAADPKHVSHAKPGAYYRAWPIDEPLKTLHTSMTKALVYPPFLVPNEGREGKQPMSAEDPLRTMTCRNETGLAIPPLLVPAGGSWNDTSTPVTDPMRTRTTTESEGVLVPPFITEMWGTATTRPTDDPLSTIVSGGNHHYLTVPPQVAGTMVMRNFSSRGDGGEMCTPAAEPLRTLTTAGHQSLVSWAALYGYDSGDLRSLGRVLPTQTTVQGDALLTGSIPEVDDCYYRMLEPDEIGRGMAFGDDYTVLGNKRERVRQYGNAVTPPASALLLSRIMTALGASHGS